MTASAADARFWDRVARKYAAARIRDMPGYERTLDRTRDLLKGTDTVLELGCGTGTTALRLARHVARLVASDVSGEMIAIAREKAAAEGCANLELTVGPAGEGPWPEHSFDAVLAFNMLHLVADRAAVLERVRRLLKPGGLLVSKTPCLGEMNRLIGLAVPVMQAIGKAPHVGFFKGAALQKEIEAAGFTIVESARHGSGRKDARIFIVARA